MKTTLSVFKNLNFALLNHVPWGPNVCTSGTLLDFQIYIAGQLKFSFGPNTLILFF